MRFLYLLGTGYLICCAALIARARTAPGMPVVPAIAPGRTGGTAAAWFTAAKPWCNDLEVESHMHATPPPAGTDGAGYAAACYALAGRIPAARARIDSLATGERARAAGIVFEIGHPVADAGDDRSAGPIMELVLEYWPENYMALYHAAMSEYTLGQFERSRVNLRRFLEMYRADDGWAANARTVLGRIEGR